MSKDMIFVTGGTGLVGTHILLELVRTGKKVRALKRKTSDMERVKRVFSYYTEDAEALFRKIEWVDGDIMDLFSLEAALDGVTHVYHSAAMVSFDPARAGNLIKINVEGTTNLVNMSLEKNIEKFAMVSSIAALGRATEGQLINEETHWKTSKNNTAYAISKFNSEREVWRGVEEGLPAIIVNPSIIIGPGKWTEGSSQLFQSVWSGFPFYSTGVNGFVDVRDVAGIIIQLMDSEVKNERFIVNAENISYKKLFTHIAESLDKKPPRIKVNRLLSEIAWREEKIRSIFTGKSPVLTKETANTALGKYYYSNQKVREWLNYDFIPVRKSVLDTGKLYKQEQKN